MKKYDYKFYLFPIGEIQDTQDWVNDKAKNGYRIINIHYHTIEGHEKVRITMERVHD